MTDPLQLCVDAIQYRQHGRLTEAEACYRAALAGEPEHRRALHGLALVLSAMRRPAEAAACWEGMLRAHPEDVATLRLLAHARREAGDPAAALATCREALRLSPGDAGSWVALGAALLADGDTNGAIAAFECATRRAPCSGTAWAALATALLRAGRADAALAAAETATTHDPRLGQAWFALGSALATLGRPHDAVAALGRALAADPAHAHAQLNLGNALLDLDRRAEAEAAIRHAIALDDTLAEAHASLGYLLTDAGDLDGAVAACTAAIERRPAFAEAHWNRGVAHLLAGNYGEGWDGFEWRKRHPAFARDLAPWPSREWRGEALDGQTLLVRAEQGLGDTIQCARFLPMLAARGASVLLACPRPLLRLLAPLATVVERVAPPPPHDLWVDMMSLPWLLGVRPESIPSAQGYLRADPRHVAAWRQRLAEPGDRRRMVGLVWAGNPAHGNDRRRSLAPDALAPILAARGWRCFGLQVGVGHAAAAARLGIPDLSPWLTDFAETAALVSALDLVIAVDTSTAHLAGALGVPTWLMLPYAPDWRWRLGCRDTLWYRSVTLFRQTTPADWSAPVAQVAAALAQQRHGRMAAGKGAPAARRGVGWARDDMAETIIPGWNPESPDCVRPLQLSRCLAWQLTS